MIFRVSRHEKTLQAVFSDPARSNIRWTAIEAMFEAYGAEISEGSGSRVRVALRGVRAVFHRPHPQRNAGKGTIRSVRRFLLEAEVLP